MYNVSWEEKVTGTNMVSATRQRRNDPITGSRDWTPGGLPRSISERGG